MPVPNEKKTTPDALRTRPPLFHDAPVTETVGAAGAFAWGTASFCALRPDPARTMSRGFAAFIRSGVQKATTRSWAALAAAADETAGSTSDHGACQSDQQQDDDRRLQRPDRPHRRHRAPSSGRASSAPRGAVRPACGMRLHGGDAVKRSGRVVRRCTGVVLRQGPRWPSPSVRRRTPISHDANPCAVRRGRKRAKRSEDGAPTYQWPWIADGHTEGPSRSRPPSSSSAIALSRPGTSAARS